VCQELFQDVDRGQKRRADGTGADLGGYRCPLLLTDQRVFSSMPNRKAVVRPNNSHPFSASIAPTSCQYASSVRLSCPLLIFARRHDFNVNSQLAVDWFDKVEAPSKHFVWFEHSAHLPMTEEPGKYLLALMTYTRPLAKPVGDTV
jgi:pimeloyl-ACP methyl ester carboxylesterase